MYRAPDRLEDLRQSGIASCTAFTSIFFRQTDTGEGSAVLTPKVAIVGRLKELIPNGDAEMAFSDGRNFKGTFVHGEIIGMGCFSWLKNRIKSIKRNIGTSNYRSLELSIVNDSSDSEYYMVMNSNGQYTVVKNDKVMEYPDSEEWERYDPDFGIWTLNLPARKQMIFTFPNKSIAVVDTNTGIGTFEDRTGTYKIDISLSLPYSSNPRRLFSSGIILPPKGPLIYKDHLGTLYYLSTSKGSSFYYMEVSRVIFRTGATIEGNFLAGHRGLYGNTYSSGDDELQIRLLSGKGILVENGLKFEFSVKNTKYPSPRIRGNGQITYTMLTWLVFLSRWGNYMSLNIEPDWIFDGKIDNKLIHAKFKTTDDRFRLIVDYTPEQNTGHKSKWAFRTSVDFKVEFLGEEVFTGRGNPFYLSDVAGDGFCLDPSNSYDIIINQEATFAEVTNICPGKLKWTVTKERVQDGIIATRRCNAERQHYSEYIKYDDRYILEVQVNADIQLKHNYIKAETLDNGSIKYRNSLRDGTLVTGELSKQDLSMQRSLNFNAIFQEGELDNIELSGNTTVGKYMLQEHILRSSIFGGYTQFGDDSVMTISEKRIGYKYEGIWKGVFKPTTMKKQLDLMKVMENYFEIVMLVDRYYDSRYWKFIYVKHTDSGILEFVVKDKRSYVSRITISRDNKLRFIK